MAFIDEWDGKRLRKVSLAKQHGVEKVGCWRMEKEDLKELSREEIIQAIRNGVLERNCERLKFENKTCFNGKLVIPIFKEFFDQYEKSDKGYCWVKKHALSILLTKTKHIEWGENITDVIEEIKGSLKESDIFIELISFMEEVNENFSKYTVRLRIPTGLKYIYQFRIYFNFRDEIITLIFSCLEKDRERWERIILGISELIEIY